MMKKGVVSNYINECGEFLYELSKGLPSIAFEYRNYPDIQISYKKDLYKKVKTTIKKLTNNQRVIIKEYAEYSDILFGFYVNKVECYRVMIK